ncbi:GNAT family N-acetyltransferase [Marinomonas posidonica]|uniref:GCN5-related N-acetyltransferase n=1 Tax=Marinomonas posidonica (strain CECT 7376 / NCIMB 14433 / IVIA-Po-181) TaxID=491952 RepID=F6D0U0_MARPP|nr:GNAT family N-acetyltransferase [Marinomonas posidonica]AEF55972.1 GCN5-related N-acetyltransferase [Marinomonas posidonica IVIA-Po-181]
MEILIDDLSGQDVKTLIQEHLDDMHATSPAESAHALDLSELKKPNIVFWTVWEKDQLLGCGALKTHNAKEGEIKSMRTSHLARNKGIASKLLNHILTTAKQSGLERISLETGPQDFFAPARALYQKNGFSECGPFADYQPDPYSVFMTKTL